MRAPMYAHTRLRMQSHSRMHIYTQKQTRSAKHLRSMLSKTWAYLCLCLHIRVGLIALMFTCTVEVIVLIHIHASVVRLIALMSAHTSEHDHAHVGITCGRALDGVCIQILAYV